MKIEGMIEWIIVEYQPLEFSVPNETVEQIIKNAIRYFNNNSAVRVTEMVDVLSPKTMVPKTIKAVSQVVPARNSMVNAAYNLPMWTLLGVQVINALNTDLIMLSETYKNMSIYMGKDFQWQFIPSDNPGDFEVTDDLTGSGTLWTPTLAHGNILPGTVIVTGLTEVFTDDGNGVMVSNLSAGTSGSISYTTGAMVLNWVDPETSAIADYTYTNGGGYIYTNNLPTDSNLLAVVGAKRVFIDEDITEPFTLDWLLRYSKALVMVAEGNVLRKGSMINVVNDGGDMITDAKANILELQEELRMNGRWLAFGGRI